jgi:hypothetical protein
LLDDDDVIWASNTTRPMFSGCATNREHRKIRERLKKGEDVFGGVGETRASFYVI